MAPTVNSKAPTERTTSLGTRRLLLVGETNPHHVFIGVASYLQSLTIINIVASQKVTATFAITRPRGRCPRCSCIPSGNEDIYHTKSIVASQKPRKNAHPIPSGIRRVSPRLAKALAEAINLTKHPQQPSQRYLQRRMDPVKKRRAYRNITYRARVDTIDTVYSVYTDILRTTYIPAMST